MFYDMMLNNKIEYLTNHTRDWTHVEDVVSAIRIILTDTRICGKLDIGSGNPVSVTDVAKAYGYRDVPVKQVSGEREETLADISLLKSYGWEPKFNILEEAKNARHR